MKSNIAWSDGRQTHLQILDESLVNYGFEPGDVVPMHREKPESESIPVWELDESLHARFLQHNGMGWAQAYTSFLSAGKISYSMTPEMSGRVSELGWIEFRQIGKRK